MAAQDWKNETNKGLHSITRFIDNKRHTKVLIMEAPCRYDLISTSCRNKEVDTFKTKLHKIAKNFEHDEIVKTSKKREYFTRHGLHMKRLYLEFSSNKNSTTPHNSKVKASHPLPMDY